MSSFCEWVSGRDKKIRIFDKQVEQSNNKPPLIIKSFYNKLGLTDTNDRIELIPYIKDNFKLSVDFILELMGGYNYDNIIQMDYLDFYDLLYRASAKQYTQLQAIKNSKNKYASEENDNDWK